MEIDKIDEQILHELQIDSRLSIRELSKRINLSPPSTAERVKRLEDSGIIEGYTIKINKKKLDFPIECIIKVTMKNGEYDRFKNFIKDYSRSEFCYRIAGDGCFLVKCSVKTLGEIEKFIDETSAFATTTTTIAFSKIEINEDIKKFLD